MGRQMEMLRELQEYYQKELTSIQARTYLRAFEKVEPDLLRKAIDEWIANETWFPRINQLNQYIERTFHNVTNRYKDTRPRLRAWRRNATLLAFQRGEATLDDLAKYPELDSRPNEKGDTELGEWWTDIEGKEYDGARP